MLPIFFNRLWLRLPLKSLGPRLRLSNIGQQLITYSTKYLCIFDASTIILISGTLFALICFTVIFLCNLGQICIIFGMNLVSNISTKSQKNHNIQCPICTFLVQINCTFCLVDYKVLRRLYIQYLHCSDLQLAHYYAF